jgi:LmbE family N-acetylglucosaminyl deacetylase
MCSEQESDPTLPAVRAAVIVAHPDDEILWAGGAILACPDWDWFLLTLCRRDDPDRAPRFAEIQRILQANGEMADLDDGPEQAPLPPHLVEQTIFASLPPRRFDRVFTHGPAGEYTRHRRHEEVCRAVVALWQADKLTADQLCMFAYEDGGRQYLPRPRRDAHAHTLLPEHLWREKYRLITEVYGFAPDSWEARATPREEAFWCFDSSQAASRHIQQSELQR